MYDNKIHNILDVKIYMDTDRELLKKWKINRDTKERKYSSEKVIQQMKDREKDYFDYIIKQKENADIIIRFYEENGIHGIEELKCNVVIQNNKIIHKIVKYIIDFNYKIQYINNDLSIELKNKVTFQNHYVMNIIENHLELFQNQYYKEIFFLLYLIYNE
jgi:phosphoribulokinase